MKFHIARWVALTVTLAIAGVATAADVNSTWFGGLGGWNVAGNWSNAPAIGGFPSNGNAGVATYAAIVSGGQANLATDLSLQSLILSNGTIHGARTIHLFGDTMTWTGGTFAGGIVVEINNSSRVNITGPVTLDGASIVNRSNQGPLSTWSGNSDIASGNGASFTNTANAQFIVQNDQTYSNSLGGLSSFNNQGFFRKTGSAGTTTFSGVAFNNTGSVNIESGTLRLAGGGTTNSSGAAFTLVPGTGLEFAGGTYQLLDSNVSMQPNSTLRINGGTLNVDKLNLNFPSFFGNVELSSGVLGGNRGVVVVSGGTLAWSGGRIAGSGGVEIDNSSRVNITGPVTLDGASIVNRSNQGSLSTWSGNSDIASGNGASFTNTANAQFIVQNDQTYSNSLGGLSSFNNQGFFRKTGSAGTTTFSGVAFNNTGSVNIESGTLRLAGGGTTNSSGAAFTLVPGTGLEFAGGTYQLLDSNVSMQPNSTVRINGGTLNVDKLNLNFPSFFGNVELSSGVLGGNRGVVVVSGGTLAWSGGRIAGSGGVEIDNSSRVNITGPVTLDGASIVNRSNQGSLSTWSGNSDIASGNGASFTNTANAQFIVQNDQTYSNSLGGLSSFTNQGLFRKTGSAGTTTFSGVAFNNTGSVNIESGTLRLAGGGTTNSSGAAFTLVPGTGLEFAGGTYQLLDSNVSMQPNSTVRINGGTLNVDKLNLNFPSFFGNVELSSGVLGGNRGVVVVSGGTLAWSGGRIAGSGGVEIDNSSRVNITGPVTLDGASIVNRSNQGSLSTWSGNSDIASGNAASFTNTANAQFIVQNDQTYSNSLGGLSSFNNQGFFRKTGSAGTTTFSGVAFNNTGSVNIDSGTLRLAAGGTTNSSGAAFTLLPGTGLEFAGGTYQLLDSNVSMQPNSTLRINGGTLNVDKLNLNFPSFFGNVQLSSGVLGGNRGVVVINGGTLAWSGGRIAGSGGVEIDNSSRVNITGPVTLDGASIVNRSNQGSLSTWSGNSDIASGNGASFTNAANAQFVVQNDQTYSNSLGGLSSFHNQGFFRKTGSAGTTTFSGVAFNNTGSVNIDSGTLRLAAGGTTTGAFFVSPGATLEFSGGIYNLNSGTSIVGNGNVKVTNAQLNFNGNVQVSPSTVIEYSQSSLVLNNSTFNSAGPLTISAGNSLSGTGVVNTSVINDGLLSPGLSPGAIDIAGTLTQGSDAYLLIELAGSQPAIEFDYVHVHGAINLGGNLTVRFLNDFQNQIAPTDMFTLLASDTSLSGFFSNVASGGRIATGLGSFAVTYANTSVVLSDFVASPPFPGDANLDGRVDFTDLGILLNNYNQPGTFAAGDFDQSGTVDFTDLGILLNNYNQSAPVTMRAATAPEPSTLALAAVSIIGLVLVVRRKR